MTTRIEIPSTLLAAFAEERPGDDFRRWVLEALVLAGVGDNLIAIGGAGEMLGLGYFQTLALIKERGVPLRISPQEFERDQEDVRRIFDELNREAAAKGGK